MSEVCPCSAPGETHSPDLHYLRTFTPAELRAHDDRIRAEVWREIAALVETLPRNEFGGQHYLAIEAAYTNVATLLSAHDRGGDVSEPYRVPSILNSRRSVMAVDCDRCGAQVRMGPHSMASAKRLLALVGPLCDSCRAALTPAPTPDDAEGKG